MIDLEAIAAQPSGALVGQDANGRLWIAGPSDPCGECEVCRRGGPAVCPSAKPRVMPTASEPRVQVAERWAVELADGLALPVPAAAAVGGDVATAYTLYARTGLAPRDPVAITGATAVTRFLVEILRAKGLVPIVLASEPAWCAWLAARGAVATSADRVGEALVAQGLGARPLRVIATGDAEAAYALAGPRATLTVLAPIASAGGAGTPVPAALLAREVAIVGVAGPHPDLVTEAAALCARGEVDLAGGVGDGPTQARVIELRAPAATRSR